MIHYQIDEIPWQRLTTAYGRGTQIPQLLEQENYAELLNLIEHQGTLWQVTPWVLYFMTQSLQNKSLNRIKNNELDVYEAVLVAQSADLERATGSMLFDFHTLLTPEYLWPESEERDEEEWEEDIPHSYDQKSFLSYYFYSVKFIREKEYIFEKLIKTQNTEIVNQCQNILNLLQVVRFSKCM